MAEVAERKDEVDTPCIGYERMAAKWSLIHDLLGGTTAMRAAGNLWLPSEQAESQKNYEVRLGRSVLFGGLRSAIERAVSRPFARPVAVKEAPEPLAALERDADAAGSSLSTLARTLFEDLATYGKAHILVDFTQIPENARGVATLADEAAAGARPTLVRVAPPALIGWQVSMRGGREVLTQARILEKSVEPKEGSRYLDEEVTRVRVLTAEGWQLWRQQEREGQKSYVLENEGPMTIGAVPLVTIYAAKVAPMEADPPFEALAWLNLAHWQSESDQRNILRVARFAILFARGLSKEEAERGFTVGPFNTITSSSKDADLRYVEHAGQAVEAGRKDLADLEARMEILGMVPFAERSANSTATGKALDAAASSSQAQEWVRALESGLRDAYAFAAEWLGLGELPDDFGIDIFSDFAVQASASDLDFLLRATVAGRISTPTFLAEIKRRGQLADSVDPEDEAERVAAEGLTQFAEVGAEGEGA